MMINKISVNFSGINNVRQVPQNIRSNIGEISSPTPIQFDSSTKEDSISPDVISAYIAPYKINPAIYAIDKDGNYTKYSSQTIASKELGITTGGISRCINSEAGKICGFVFVSALDIEKLDEDGNVVVNEAKVQELSKKLQSNNGYYVIEKDGSFKRYSSPEETIEMTGVEEETLTRGFSGYRKVIGDQIFVKAPNIEREKVDGSPLLEPEKIITVFIGNRNAFYAIDEEGKATLFHSHSQAYGDLGCSSSAISSCINGKIKNSQGYTYARPLDVLTVNEQNQIVVDEKKINSLLRERFGK